MYKQIWILCILVTISVGFVYARVVTNDERFQFLRDTTDIKKDSVQPGLLAYNNPTELSREAVTSGSSSAINMEFLNPLAISFVEDYIDQYAKTLENIKDDRKPYLDMIDNVLVQHGLPKELKYLAVIESYLKPNARSGAGAVGFWQLMPATARHMGLKVTSKVDERKNVTKSTHAASRYLTSLYSMYGDWLLVIAAYNSGPGPVNSAIKKSGSRNFWELQRYLPMQSQKHVKKFIATHYYMEGQGSITTLTKEEAKNFLLNAGTLSPADTINTKKQRISGRYISTIIAKHLEMELAAFMKINPGFDKTIAEKGVYDLRLPSEKMLIFLSIKNEILNESVQQLLNPNTGSATSTTPQSL